MKAFVSTWNCQRQCRRDLTVNTQQKNLFFPHLTPDTNSSLYGYRLRSREFVGKQGAIPFSRHRFFHYFKWWVYWSFFHNLFNYGFGRRGLVLFFHYLSLDEKSFAFSIPCLFLSWLIAGGNEWDRRIKCPLWKASLPSL